jgi:hypothetical protein
MNLNCLVLRHRWRPAEETNEDAMRLACTRWGKSRRARSGKPIDPVAKVGVSEPYRRTPTLPGHDN